MKRQLGDAKTEESVPLTLVGAWWSTWYVRCDEHNWQSQAYWLASTVIGIGRMHVHFHH